MKIEINKTNANSLYQKAEFKFSECVNSEDNKFLHNEIDFPMESIILKRDNIKIVFLQEITENYTFEINLILFFSDKVVGKYTYYIDEKGIPLDDVLVFY